MKPQGWNQDQSPYHPAEQELHERLGRKEQQEKIGRSVLRPYMPEQHRTFFAQLPFVIVGVADSEGWPWASILSGEPGFVSSGDKKTLTIDARPLANDPVSPMIVPGQPIGLLGIELPTRRRNRVNGVVKESGSSGFEVSVVQSFGNCPQYIHTRDAQFNASAATVQKRDPIGPVSSIDARLAAVIQSADTFFVASHNEQDDRLINGGADVSHRGGKPGFIKVAGNTLTIPDFAGNNFFNTMGNFLSTPKAGLLFIDFETNDIWQLTGNVELQWESSDEIANFKGALRTWRFTLERGICHENACPIQWQSGEPSPRSLATGSW